MSICTILVPVSAAEVGLPALETAMGLASRFGAHIEALHVRADPKSLVPYAGEGMNGSMIEEIMDVTEREGSERASRARATFDKFVADKGLRLVTGPGGGGSGVSISWREELGREDEVVALRGRVADLTVVGRPMRDAPLPSPITLEAALLETGRPIIIVPPGGTPSVATHCAVAWEGSTEAARAINGALDILSKAERVTIITGVGSAEPPLPPEECRDYLAWHGIKGEVHRFDPGDTEIGHALLAEAVKMKSDLLVKGAYSQSRLKQMILGGRTRYIIANTQIPVLLAH